MTNERIDTISAILVSHSIEDETKVAAVVKELMAVMGKAKLSYNEAECVLKLCAEEIKYTAVLP